MTIEQSDSRCVKAALAGDKAAYARLYDRYAPLVRALCYDSTGSLADAQDLAQDVFLRAYEKLGSLDRPELFAGWVVGITRRRCQEWRRRKRRAACRRALINDCESAAAGSSNNGHIELLRKTISRLDNKERLVLHAFYLQGKSADQARRPLGLSRSGFYRALGRARKRLQTLLAEELEKTR